MPQPKRKKKGAKLTDIEKRLSAIQIKDLVIADPPISGKKDNKGGFERCKLLNRLWVGMTRKSDKSQKFKWHCIAVSKGCGAEYAHPLQRHRALTHSEDCTLLLREDRDDASLELASGSVGTQLTKLSRKMTEEGRTQQNLRLSQRLTTFIATTGVAPHVVGHPAFLELAAELDSKWKVPCPTTLSQSLLPGQAADVKLRKIQLLRSKKNLSISFDGGSLHGFSMVTVHVIEEDSTSHTIACEDGTSASHTAQWYCNMLDQVS